MTPVETKIRELAQAQQWKPAAAAAIEGYGPEILGYLAAVLRDESAAGDVFSQFCEDLWNGLPKFRWQSSLRTWAYTLARHASLRYLRSPEQRRPRVPLEGEISALAHKVRTNTAAYLRSDVKAKVQAIRESLDVEDQTLLILRVDRNLAWNEVAEIMLEEDPPAQEAISRKAAALRKRFERVKDQLRELARAQGLLEEP